MKEGVSLFEYIYALNKSVIIFLMLLMFLSCILLEAVLYVNVKKAEKEVEAGRKLGKARKAELLERATTAKKALYTFYIILALMFLANLAGMLYDAVFNRSTGEQGVYLELFHYIKAYPNDEEMVRTCLMNAFLYFPMGLSLVVLLPHKWNVWLRVGVVTLFGFCMSCGCEYIQYVFKLGLTEADDVFFNTIGILLGALHAPLGEFLAKKETLQKAWGWLHR